MSKEDPVPLRSATAAKILDSLDWLEEQALEELNRIGARYVLSPATGSPLPLIEQHITYLYMAHDWPGTRELRQELKLSDDQVLSAAKLFDILNFVHWTRIGVARGDDFAYLFSVTLERLSAVPMKEIVASWNLAAGRQRGGKTSPKRKAATVKLLQRILREEGNLGAKDLWHLAGSEDHESYWQIELDGETYEFRKDEDGNLGISRLDPNGGDQRLKSQPFNKTFYRWCKEARDNLSTLPT